MNTSGFFLLGLTVMLLITNIMFCKGLEETSYFAPGSYGYKKSWSKVLEGILTFWAWSGAMLFLLVLWKGLETSLGYEETLVSPALYGVVFLYLVLMSYAGHEAVYQSVSEKSVLGEFISKKEKRVERLLWVLMVFMVGLFYLSLFLFLWLGYENFKELSYTGGFHDSNFCKSGDHTMTCTMAYKIYISPSGNFWVIFELEHFSYKGGDDFKLDRCRVSGVSNYFWFMQDQLHYTEGNFSIFLVDDFDWGL